MPRVETRGSENEEENKHDMQNDIVMCQTIHDFTGYRNPFNSRHPQHHAAIDTCRNNGPLWRHNR